MFYSIDHLLLLRRQASAQLILMPGSLVQHFMSIVSASPGALRPTTKEVSTWAGCGSQQYASKFHACPNVVADGARSLSHWLPFKLLTLSYEANYLPEQPDQSTLLVEGIRKAWDAAQTLAGWNGPAK